MTIEFYGHPFSSYCMKALIAFYENGIPFEWRMVSPEHPENGAAWAARWPIRKFPIIVDGDTQVMEATSIVEYLAVAHPGPVNLIPADPRTAVEVRMMDRIFDNYVMTPQGKCVFDVLRPAEDIDDVDTLIAGEYLRKLIERTDGRLTEHRLGKGIHRDDPVAEALQSPRDGVTRTCAVGRQSDDRDGTGFGEECRDLLRLRIHEHGASVALAGRYV